GETEQFNSETLLRLPHSFWCYPALPDPPPVAPLPAEKNAFVTFGSLNNPCKVSRPAMELWQAVLDAVPGSRLILSSLDESPRRWRATSRDWPNCARRSATACAPHRLWTVPRSREPWNRSTGRCGSIGARVDAGICASTTRQSHP